jgi:hypothetical protein
VRPFNTLCCIEEDGPNVQKKTIRAAEQDRPDVAQRRIAWHSWSKTADPARLIFIDETWTKTNMVRLRGRAPRGERLIGKTPYGHWQTTTLIAALGIKGMHCAAVIDGAINADAFEAFVEQVLVAQLKPGDIVIMDNLSSPRSRADRSDGCRVALPASVQPRSESDRDGFQQDQKATA